MWENLKQIANKKKEVKEDYTNAYGGNSMDVR